MNTKLTLNIEKHVIEDAKAYAKINKISLSQLIENYLSSLTRKNKKDIEVSPLVESLTGIIPSDSVNDHKEDYYDYLNRKYS